MESKEGGRLRFMTTPLHLAEHVPARSARAFSSTKGRLLTLLRRLGPCTVDELSTALALAPMTVRQHLATLERDELVQVEEVRNGPGRPRHVYRLTKEGEEAFPKRYEALAAGLLRELAELDAAELAGKTPLEKQELVLNRLATREAERVAPRMAGKSLAQRVALVAQLLETESGLAEWEPTEHGYEIREYNCVYRRVAEQEAATCTWHVRLLSQMIGATVTHTGEPLSRGGACCRFQVAAEPLPVQPEPASQQQ